MATFAVIEGWTEQVIESRRNFQPIMGKSNHIHSDAHGGDCLQATCLKITVNACAERSSPLF